MLNFESNDLESAILLGLKIHKQLGIILLMQDSNIDHSGLKKSSLDSVEPSLRSIANEGNSANKRTLIESKIDNLTPEQSLKPKKLPKLKVSKISERLPYSELEKVDISITIDYKNCRLPSLKLYGNVETLRSDLDLYDIPKISEKNPIAISIQVRDEANLLQNETAILEITHILNFHLCERIRQQLPNIPNQLLSTEFSAMLLCIHHDSILELLEEGVLQYENFENVKCVKSIDLFEYLTKIYESRELALSELLQCEQ